MKPQFRDRGEHLIALLLLFTMLGTAAGWIVLGGIGLWTVLEWITK